MDSKKFVNRCYFIIFNDDRLLPSHLSMFFGLILIRTKEKCTKSFRISRKDLMILSKINSSSTYHRCISDLVEFGYISYAPSFDHYKGSKVQILIEI
jgi:hypothetical protein